MFKEELLHYIWKFKRFKTQELCTVDGEEVKILNPGQHNFDGGPDFFNAKIKVGNTIWAGNVEIHIRSSDWLRHHHQKDKAYQNVILHVVYEHDKEIFDSNGNLMKTIVLENRLDKTIIQNYERLTLTKNWVPCAEQLKTVEEFVINHWKERLVLERLERKSLEIEEHLKENKNNWEETFYRYWFKYFGLKVNAIPFEILAQNTPLKIIEKHNTLIGIEALLFGQAGFLDNQFNDKYGIQLKKEYAFLRSKFSLQPTDKSCWKFMRLRPNNFPTLRISQLANLLANGTRLFSRVLEASSVKELKKLLTSKASSYWDNHYQFEIKAEKVVSKKVGESLSINIIINVVVPFVFLYGKIKQNEDLQQRALTWLSEIKPEKNTIIKRWNELGIRSDNASDSQSLIELKNNYCSQKKCLNCHIGNNLLKQ